METNAAEELLALVDSWGRDGAVSTVRAGADRSGLWPTAFRAVRLLAEVESFLATQDDADEYDDLIAELRRFVFASDVVWTKQRTALDKRDRLQLKLVSRLMAASPLRAVLTPAQIDALREAVEKSLEVLDAEPRQIEQGANYLRYLLQRCLDLLAGEDVDLLALRHLSFEATGVAVGVASQLPDEKREALGQSIGVLATTWFLGATSGAAANLISGGLTALPGLLGS